MAEISTLTAVASMSRLLAPVLSGLYASAKAPVKSSMQGWKAGEDLDKISEYYTRLASVKTIFSRDEALAIDSFYYPSKIATKGKSASFSVHSKLGVSLRAKTVDGLRDLPKGHLVVEGVVGQGKSIFMRHLALSMLSDDVDKKIPIFIELRNVSKTNSLRSLVRKAFQAIGVEVDDGVIKYLSKKDKLVFVLDGFDEVSQELVSDLLVEINELKNLNSGLRIIVSSRPQNAIQNVPEFNVVSLMPLGPKDHNEFLKKLGVDTVRREELVEAVKSSPKDIQEAISTPLMMTIMVLVYESVKQIPPYLSDFFSALFHVVFTQHDSLKEAFRREHHTGLSESKLQHLFEAFCFVVMQRSYGRTLTKSQFNECFEKASKYVPKIECSVEQFRSDIVGVACLMLEEGVGEATFLHKGILDYFAAAFAARFEKLSENFYKSIARSYLGWKVSLHFLEKIDRHRYLKFYYLSVVVEELKALSEALGAEDELSFEGYVVGLFDGGLITKQSSVISYGLMPVARNELAYDASRAVIERVSHTHLFDIDNKKFSDFASNTKRLINVADTYVELSLEAWMEMFGVDGIRSALAAVENDYAGRVRCAREELKAFESVDAVIDMSFEI
ncbi:TPA: NACHT domain-containing NTPase [Pseudomonas putida]